MSAGGGCEAAVTFRIRFGWAMFMECGGLPYGKMFYTEVERGCLQLLQLCKASNTVWK